jgi:hypothetical protein
VECVIRTYAVAGENHVFRTSGNFGCDINGTNSSLRYYMSDFTAETAYTSVGSFSSNIWHFLTMTYDRPNKTQAIYKNGQLISSTTHSVSYDIATPYILWCSRSDLYQSGINGDAAFAKFYTRVLSPSEILQNFNAVRGRFGI